MPKRKYIKVEDELQSLGCLMLAAITTLLIAGTLIYGAYH